MAPARPSTRSTNAAEAMPTTTSTNAMESDGDADVVPSGREDDELTSLTWLQDRNLLKSIRAGAGAGSHEEALSDASPAGSSADDYESSDGGGGGDGLLLVHPAVTHVPYNPKVHVTAKPPYSFSCLIFMAIEDATAKALPVKDIYSWILTHFPYFQNAPTGWKNSVRHNLSLNKCFRKVDKDKGQNIGKGSLWCIDPDYRPNLLQALRKTPYHPYHQLQMMASPPSTHVQLSQKTLPLAPRLKVNVPNPELFPYLSKRLAASSIKDPEADAAATMLALKNGPQVLADCEQNYYNLNGNTLLTTEKRSKRFRTRFRSSTPGYLQKLRGPFSPVITTNPSEDHTYSSCVNSVLGTSSASPQSSVDEPFEFSELASNTDDDSNTSSYDEDFDSEEDVDDMDNDGSIEEEDWENVQNRGNQMLRSEDDEERKKIVEGADALLNLAGIKTNLAPGNKRANHAASATHLARNEKEIVDAAQR